MSIMVKNNKVKSGKITGKGCKMKLKVKVCNPYGVKNQFVIETDQGNFFQSYNSVICFISKGKVYLDKYKWNYSKTTGKYRNRFLGETIEQTMRKIKTGEYSLVDLNGGE